MLQLNHSQATNTNAVYPSITASAGTTQVLLDFTQSYDYSTKTGVIATLANIVGPNNPWLVIQLTGSLVPTASGQYDVNIWSYTQVTGGLSTWIAQNTLFGATNELWSAGPGGVIRNTLLSTERAFVSGSNGVSTTTYLLPSNGGKYTTYNHP